MLTPSAGRFTVSEQPLSVLGEAHAGALHTAGHLIDQCMRRIGLQVFASKGRRS